MCFRFLVSAVLLAVWAHSAGAQSVEQRLSVVEWQVTELRALNALPPQLEPAVSPEMVANEHLRWGYPGGHCTVLVKTHYVVCHKNANRIPEWVTYRLTTRNLEGDVERSEDFRADTLLRVGARAELADYGGSGYDRGHMAPAAAFKRSETAMSETFLLSNMAPQTPSLNRGVWRELEDDVRSLGAAHGSIWVFTGSLFLDDDGNPAEPTTFIGANDVAVPTHFYKVILSELTSGEIQLFAFLMANHHEALRGDPEDYAVSVDSIEALSRLDFFSLLPDADEDRLEALVATEWPLR